MSSIAIFPCPPTHESGIIGELSSTLTLKIYTDENLLDECMQLGAFAYINKPVNIEELSATIKAANDKVQSQKLKTA